MHGYVGNIEQEALTNENFRRVVYTSGHVQLVVMSLKPGEDIGAETHELDQFIRIEAGDGVAVMNDIEHPLADGSALLIPAGVRHNVMNTGDVPLKLYSLYAPPEHKDQVVHATKEDAEAHEEHFDGKTSE